MDLRALGGIERYEHRALLTRLTGGEGQARQESLKS
jgi:hypothetical protein